MYFSLRQLVRSINNDYLRFYHSKPILLYSIKKVPKIIFSILYQNSFKQNVGFYKVMLILRMVHL